MSPVEDCREAATFAGSEKRMLALAQHGMQPDPLDGALYVVVNRRGAQLESLYIERSGVGIQGLRLARRVIADAHGSDVRDELDSVKAADRGDEGEMRYELLL